MLTYFFVTKKNRSRGLIQSVSRKTRNILDRLANRRARTSSADGQLYLGDSNERPISPSYSTIDHQSTPISHTRSTSKAFVSLCITVMFSFFSIAPDVISSSLTSARHYQPTNSNIYPNRNERLHQSTDSLADSSSKGMYFFPFFTSESDSQEIEIS